MPPMPSARSSDSAPVGMAATFTWAPSSPMRMTVPLPNWRSICASAPCRAASRALASWLLIWSDGVWRRHRTRPQHAFATNCDAPDQCRFQTHERHVAGAVRMQARDEQRERLAEELQRLRGDGDRARRAGARPEARDGRVGAERALLGCVDAGGREARRSRGTGGAASVPSGSARAAHRTRGRRGGSSSASVRARRARDPPRRSRTSSMAGTSSAGRRPRNASVRWSASGATGRQIVRVGGRVPEGDERVAGGGRQLERDEEARRRTSRARRTRTRPADEDVGVRRRRQSRASDSPRSSRRSRCMTAVVVRSRIIARSPGSCSVRSIRASPGRDADADHADRLLRRPPSRAGDAGDADAHVGAEPRPRPVGQRDRHLRRDRAHARRSARLGDVRQRHLGLVRVHDHARRARRPTSPRARSAVPPSARPCRTRRRPPSNRRPEQQRGDDLVDRRAVAREHGRPVALQQRRLERVVRAGGRRRRRPSPPRAPRGAGRS